MSGLPQGFCVGLFAQPEVGMHKFYTIGERMPAAATFPAMTSKLSVDKKEGCKWRPQLDLEDKPGRVATQWSHFGIAELGRAEYSTDGFKVEGIPQPCPLHSLQASTELP